MYYDTYRGRRGGKRDRRERRGESGCLGWLLGSILKLLLFVILLVALVGGALYILPVSLMNVEPSGMSLSPADGLPANRVNVLLLGLDALDSGKQRSDSIMIASVGSDGVRLLSLMRDTMVEVPGHGRHKLNAAHALGGPELAMRTINENFQLNITNYVAVDFRTLVDLVDALGGVEVNIEEKELSNLNSYAYYTLKSISGLDPQKYAHYQSAVPETRTGKLLLDGIFTTGYTRIRYTDSDYVRASRQREVFSALIARFKQCCWKPGVYVKLWNVVQEDIRTNLNLFEMISLAEKAVLSGNVATGRAPMDEYKSDSSSAIEITDAAGNIRAVRAFLYD